jgi:GTP cyclohydrolase IB
MEDVQRRPDARGVVIDRAGVCNVRFPIVVLDRELGKQQTVGTFSLCAGVPHDQKGTHMSRFLEVLHDHVGEITLHTIPRLLDDVRDRLETDTAGFEVQFPYFAERRAPVSGARGLVDYECWFSARADGRHEDFVLGVRTPVTSLCPCSKAISDYGAHNQRASITIELRTRRSADGEQQLVWIEELIDISEEAASAPVYSVVKRADERYLTMHAHDNPVFVEDMARDVAARLEGDERIAWFRVNALSSESIHNHDAFAEIESPSPDAPGS